MGTHHPDQVPGRLKPSTSFDIRTPLALIEYRYDVPFFFTCKSNRPSTFGQEQDTKRHRTSLCTMADRALTHAKGNEASPAR